MGRIAECGWCNEFLFEANKTIVDAGPVDQLLVAFRLTNEQVAEQCTLPEHFIERHVSVLRENDVRRLDEEGATIENDAICNDDADITAMNAHVEDDDNNDVAESPASSTVYDLVHAAVLPKPSLLSGGVNLVLQALSNIIHPNDKNAGNCAPPPIVVVSRGEDPIVEWYENDVLMSAVFASLLLRHLFLYYDGRFEDLFFIATAFNQLQRHACVRQTARISAKRATQLQKLGELANSSAFRQRLLWAHDNPLSDEANKLNAKVCRIMSMVGSTVPFSPFEREAMCPKLAAMHLRYGIGSHFLTGSPPEFEDLSILRLAIMRDTCQWNNDNCPLQRTGFMRADLPDDFVSNAGARMAVMRPHPAVGAMSFANHMRILLDDVARCPMAAHTRVSRDYLQRERGAQLIRPHHVGLIVWEMRRPATNAMLVELNLITTNLVGCHNNSSFTSGQDAGEAVEEYKAAYMMKEGAPLCQANAVLLSAPDDIAQHLSVADDTAMAHGTGKHLASRTVNAFTGGHQWSMPLMVHALLGVMSEVQTETFRYLFPHAAVGYVDRKLDRTIDEDGENDDPPAPDVDPPVDDDQFVDKALDALVFAVDPDDKGDGSLGGVTAYKLPSGDVVFMLQAE
ncbi:unnamed protein product [Lampetra fluviatilis]